MDHESPFQPPNGMDRLTPHLEQTPAERDSVDPAGAKPPETVAKAEARDSVGASALSTHFGSTGQGPSPRKQGPWRASKIPKTCTNSDSGSCMRMTRMAQPCGVFLRRDCAVAIPWALPVQLSPPSGFRPPVSVLCIPYGSLHLP